MLMFLAGCFIAMAISFALIGRYFNGTYWDELTAFLDERDKRIIKAFQNNKDHKGHNVL